MASAWGLLFAAKCRRHVYLRTVAVADERITNTAVAIVMWTSSWQHLMWQQHLQLADPVT